jgi:hypothetical protein
MSKWVDGWGRILSSFAITTFTRFGQVFMMRILSSCERIGDVSGSH